MERAQPLFMALLIIASVGVVPQAAGASDDEWADSCSEAPVIEGNGTYSGELIESGERDVFRVRLSQSEYLDMETSVPSESGDLGIEVYYYDSGYLTNAGLEFRGMNNAGYDRGETTSNAWWVVKPRQDTSSEWELWAKEPIDSPVCIEFRDRGWETPYKWEISINRSSPDLSLYEVQQLETEIREIQSEVEEKDQQIRELEALLEEKNQTISDLESESQSTTSVDSGGVTIDVTGTPANGQQNFVEGGEALVQAESENADVSEMAVEYGSGTYQLDSSGQVAIPLAQTGPQEMTVVYEDTTKQVSFEVQAQGGQNQQNQQNQRDTTTTGTGSPGFGIVVALIALLGNAFLLQRYRHS